MGQASQRKSATARLLEAPPWCCFCGGDTPATELDHVPSRQMFREKLRPRGLEFPACAACNRSSSIYELLFSLLSRVNWRVETAGDKRDLQKLLREISRTFPGCLEHLDADNREYRRAGANGFDVRKHHDEAGLIDVSRSIETRRAINIVGAKLGLALHYQHTGRIVPLDGGVRVRMFTNMAHVMGKIPPEVRMLVGEWVTLRAGAWTVEDQFSYTCALPEGGRSSAYICLFRESFSLLIAAFESRADIEPRLKAPLIPAGYLRGLGSPTVAMLDQLS